MPPADFIAHICKQYGISERWFLTGEGPMRGQDEIITLDGHEFIPLYNVDVSAGPGEIPIDESVREYLPLKVAWLKAELHTGVANLFLMPVRGDSMEPVIRKGDIILVDRSEERVRDDDIYVIRREGFLSVKRLQLRPGGKIQVISENKSYPDYTVVLAHTDDFAIVGRVIWYGRNL